MRGWTDLAINGSFWIGAALGAVGAVVLLDPACIDPVNTAGAPAFLIGALLALVIFFMRLWLPESPRWLMTHGRVAEAERDRRRHRGGFARSRHFIRTGPWPAVSLRTRSRRLGEVSRRCDAHPHARRSWARADDRAGVFLQRDLLHLCAGADRFLRGASQKVGWYILPFAAGNVLGPLLLGRLFDTIGRRPMIAFTYAISGVLLAVAG